VWISLYATLGARALEQGGIFPRHVVEGSRGDVFGNLVQPVRHWVIGGRIRPVTGEDLVRLPAQQQRIKGGHALGHDLTGFLIEVGNLPPALVEAALVVPCGHARCLHNAVERGEGVNYELSHSACSQ
jgi:hypothetical protein